MIILQLIAKVVQILSTILACSLEHFLLPKGDQKHFLNADMDAVRSVQVSPEFYILENFSKQYSINQT